MEPLPDSLKGFIPYLQQKGLSPSSQKAYAYSIRNFLLWYGEDPVSCTKRDILSYLSYLKEEKGQGNTTRQCNLYALQHLFNFLQKEEAITTKPTSLLKLRGTKTKKLHQPYTKEELHQLYDRYHLLYLQDFDDSRIPQNQQHFSYLSRQRNYVMLGLLIYQGIVPREFNRLSLGDIDISKARVHIHGKTKATDRTLPLEASQMGGLIHYLEHIRPHFLDYCTETDQVFFALPASGKHHTSSSDLTEASRHLCRQLKAIQPGFKNLRQLRASRIVQWLQSEGLRKTQYLAGHKSIASTEEYLPGTLDQLSEDLQNFNPFSL